MTKPSENEIREAIEVLVDIEHAEADSDHQMEIARVRRMLVGVFDMENFLEDFKDDDRIDTLREVLESINPEDQHYADSETVEREVQIGQEFAELYDR